MTIDFGNTGINLQIIPIYGLSAGVLYYNPNLEPDIEEVHEDDFYHQLTIMCLVFGLHITVWKY
jgi:hypothetical protein